MVFSTTKTAANCLEKGLKFQHDIVPQQKFDFTNPRTWEVLETKGSERPFLAHGTWEGTENNAVVGNVRNRNFHGDKVPQREANFGAHFYGESWTQNSACSDVS